MHSAIHYNMRECNGLIMTLRNFSVEFVIDFKNSEMGANNN